MIELASLSKWWHSRTDRERRILTPAAALSVVLLLVLLFAPLLGRYLESKYHYATLTANYQWLQTFSDPDVVSNARCNDGLNRLDQFKPGDLSQQLQTLGVTNRSAPGIESELYTTNADGSYTVALKEIDGQQLLAWVEQLPCLGMVLNSLELERVSENYVTAKLKIGSLL